MLKSNAGQSFTEVAHNLGISGEFVGDYFGEGWADFNLDGAIDFFAAGHIDKYRLFKNNNCPGTSLSVTLKGVLSNPNGIGAKVKTVIGSNVVTRFMLPSGGLHDFSELKLVIGLNGAYCTDSLIVYWPSGIVQKFGATNAGQNLVIVEDTVSTGVINNPSIMNNFQVSPNPFHNRFTVRFSLRQKRFISITLLNLQGKTIETLVSETVEKGVFAKQFDGSNLPQGLYLIRVRNGNHYLMKKMLKQ